MLAYRGRAKNRSLSRSVANRDGCEHTGPGKLGMQELKALELQREFQMICLSAEEGEFISKPSIDSKHLERSCEEKLRKLIMYYVPRGGKQSPIEMKLVLADDVPVYQRPRRMPYADQQFVEKQVTEWLHEGIIQPSTSEYASPIVLVQKKNGNKRLCCDYRKLNEKVIRDNFPMSLMDDVIERLQGAKVYTSLDLANGFLHVPIERNSQKFTSFVTHSGQFEFRYVPFGISNSPAVFCRYISSILRPLIQNGMVVVYMDDIIIPSKDEDEGLQKLEILLKVAAEYGLRINWDKCQFLRRRIDFLGYIVENNTIRPSVEKTKAIREFPVPVDRKSLQRFLGLTSYFRRFVEGFAVIAKPLTDLLRKKADFKMDIEQLLAFEQLKESLVSAPVLKLFNPQAPTEVHTDASMYGYGAILLQKDQEDQQFHPIQFMSRKTSPVEEKYHSYELEVLAIIEALKKWRVYVMGTKFKIVTDCNAFTMTMAKRDVPLRVSRWAMFLQEFDYVIEHRPATKMKHVDALSRGSCLMIGEPLNHRIKEAQLADTWIRAVRTILEKDPYEDYFLKFGMVYKDPVKELIVVPSLMENEIISMAHQQGHFSVKKTQHLIEKTFYIPSLKKKATNIIKSCVQCIITQSKAGRKEGFLVPIDKEDRPLGTYHVDHVGPMESTHKRYNHILVVVDAFSKFTWLYPVKSTGSEEVVEKLKKQSIIFGNPKRIISDRGSAFTSTAFREYCKNEGIQHLQITTGVPRGNGQVERTHKIVVPMLAKACLGSDQNWYKYVEKVQQVLNNTPSRSTKYTPFRILTGLEMRVPDYPDFQEMIEKSAMDELIDERDEMRETVRENILKVQSENKRTHDKVRVQEQTYNVNELVAIKRTQFGSGMKLRPKFLGPYKIVKKLNNALGDDNPTALSSDDYSTLEHLNSLATQPVFDFGMPRNITARAGQTAAINCRVEQLGDKSVSWIRKRDLHILTAGILTYTSDERFKVIRTEDLKDWSLQVKYAQPRDSGIYECQVNTEPKISMAFRLNVIVTPPDSKAIISGPADLYVKVGSAITLTCHVKQPTSQDIGPIHWYRGPYIITPFVVHPNDAAIDLSRRISMESQLGDILKSRLRIANAQTTDSGNYTCLPTTAEGASVMVHVINDENPAAMQKSNASRAVSTSSTSISFVNILCFIKIVTLLLAS